MSLAIFRRVGLDPPQFHFFPSMSTVSKYFSTTSGLVPISPQVTLYSGISASSATLKKTSFPGIYENMSGLSTVLPLWCGLSVICLLLRTYFDKKKLERITCSQCFPCTRWAMKQHNQPITFPGNQIIFHHI